MKESDDSIVGAQFGIELEHIGEDKDIGVVCRVENEGGVRRRSVEARAVGDEKCRPVAVVVEGILNYLGVKLFQVI